MEYLPFIVFVLIIAGLIVFAGRTRRRQATQQAAMAERIGVGTDVMTTSGLHGTVVARNDDETVMLSIAPGVEVRWELAALRDLAGLPQQFQRAPGGAQPPVSSDLTTDLTKHEPADDGPQTGSESR